MWFGVIPIIKILSCVVLFPSSFSCSTFDHNYHSLGVAHCTVKRSRCLWPSPGYHCTPLQAASVKSSVLSTLGSENSRLASSILPQKVVVGIFFAETFIGNYLAQNYNTLPKEHRFMVSMVKVQRTGEWINTLKKNNVLRFLLIYFITYITPV